MKSDLDMSLTLFEFAPLYIPTDLRKLILSFSAPIHAYIGCIIEGQDYIRVLGVCRTLLQVAKKCLEHKNANRRFNMPQYHILKMEEGDVLSDKIYSLGVNTRISLINGRVHYPFQIPRNYSPLYHTYTMGTVLFNQLCSFCMEPFERYTLMGQFPCNYVPHSTEIRTWLESALHCPLCRKLVRDELQSPLEVGETVYIDEGNPYVLGVGGPRRLVLSLSDTSQKNIDFYDTIESTWKLKLHPKGGGVPHPYKFFVE